MNDFEKFLKKHNITQYRFHKITGIPQTTLQDIKKRDHVPSYMKYMLQLMEFKKSVTGNF